MSLTVQEKAAVATEIKTDPKSLGYSAFVNSSGIPVVDDWQQGIYDLINDTVVAGDRVDGDVVDSSYLRQEMIAGTEVNSIGPNVWIALEGYINGGPVNIASDNVQTALLGMFNAEAFPVTRANILAAKLRDARRIEKVIGKGRSVSLEDIAQSLGR